MTLVFPTLEFSSERWRLQPSARSGGKSITESQQWVASPTGPWTAHLIIALRTKADAVDLEGFLDGLTGPVTPFLIGPQDWGRMPWQEDTESGFPITPAYSDPAVADSTAVLDFTLAADAAAQATTIVIHRNVGGILKRGYMFSIGERLYRIVAPPTDAGGVADVTVQIRPWLRAGASSGAALNFAAPTGQMQLLDTSQGQIDFTPSPTATVTLDLIEPV